MPAGAYFKGSGVKIRHDMIKRYGPELGTRIFYAKAAKMRLRPGDKSNLATPKKGWRKGQKARVLKAARRLRKKKK